jgi:N6-L-threonylcarbamoyladenine synthase
MKMLGIETSCDETAAAVVEDGRRLLSNVVASSVDLHQAYGGVVPEIAARSHLEVITPVIQDALVQAKCDWSDIDGIAVTQGPGLLGSLLIGVMTARTLAIAQDKPLFPINHVLAHLYAAFLTESAISGYQLADLVPALPALALIISGGHSHLILVEDHGKYQVIGRTLDDAVGEAFDKVAKMLGLPYPGGPSIGNLAKKGDRQAVKLPTPKLAGYDFSFSGLKTAVLRAAQAQAGKDYTLPSKELPGLLSGTQKAGIAASFEDTALNYLLDNLERAIADFRPASVIIGGGVAASPRLRELTSNRGITGVIYPDFKLCTDNAAMIAAMAAYSAVAGDPYRLEARPDLSL